MKHTFITYYTQITCTHNSHCVSLQTHFFRWYALWRSPSSHNREINAVNSEIRFWCYKNQSNFAINLVTKYNKTVHHIFIWTAKEKPLNTLAKPLYADAVIVCIVVISTCIGLMYPAEARNSRESRDSADLPLMVGGCRVVRVSRLSSRDYTLDSTHTTRMAGARTRTRLNWERALVKVKVGLNMKSWSAASEVSFTVFPHTHSIQYMLLCWFHRESRFSGYLCEWTTMCMKAVALIKSR